MITLKIMTASGKEKIHVEIKQNPTLHLKSIVEKLK